MRRYRVEIFDRDLNFRSFYEASQPDIYIDALVQTVSTVACPVQVTCERGDYIQIRIDGQVYYQGIVTDCEYDGKTSQITIEQLSALLNTEVFADVSLLSGQTIEQWLTDLFNATFAGSDTFQNLVGLTITSESATNGSHTASDNGVYNLYDLCNSFFKVYGVIVDISFDPSSKEVDMVLKSVSASVLKLDLKVSDVEKYDIQKSLKEDSPNKMIIKNEDDLSQSETYYWHPTDFSGTVDTDGSTDRVIPVIVKCEQIQVDEGDTFANSSYQSAVNTMYSTRYDDLITVTIRAKSNLINVDSLEIGQLFALIEDGTAYNTMLTGIHAVNMGSVELTFGYVRKRLTQILKMRG